MELMKYYIKYPQLRGRYQNNMSAVLTPLSVHGLRRVVGWHLQIDTITKRHREGCHYDWREKNADIFFEILFYFILFFFLIIVVVWAR